MTKRKAIIRLSSKAEYEVFSV